MGPVHFKRTGYVNKKTGEYCYLLDEVLGFDNHQRITLGVAAKVLEETIMSIYAKGGQVASAQEGISKQSVKKLVHETIVSAQFLSKKGDLTRDTLGRKINTIMPKVVCLYEDVINESGEKSKNPRYKLVGKRYFSGVHKGSQANEKFWQQVQDYISEVYDTEYLERIYIAGDGASWIKAGTNVLDKSKFVLDKFHMMKYINTSVVHLLDSAGDVKSDIWEALNGADKTKLKEIYKKILDVTESQNKYEEVEKALAYLLNTGEESK